MRFDVRETPAGKSLSAIVIMRGARRVATVLAHYGSGGAVKVNVWQDSDAAERSLAAFTRDHAKLSAAQLKRELASLAADDGIRPFSYQAAQAGGGGYDKFTAALAGMYIDGAAMGNHCSRRGAPRKPKGSSVYPDGFKPPAGYRLANYSSAAGGWSDCYRDSGLDYLEARGYVIIRAI